MLKDYARRDKFSHSPQHPSAKFIAIMLGALAMIALIGYVIFRHHHDHLLPHPTVVKKADQPKLTHRTKYDFYSILPHTTNAPP